MLTRRSFLRAVGVSAAASLLPGCGARAGGPNVLFISIDDMNDWTGDLGGHPQALTPHIDALGRRGVLFTNAHSPATSCGGARSSILTGIRPYTSGIYANRHQLRRELPEAVTLMQHFMQGGYYVAGSGKIFHQPDPVSWNEFHPENAKQRPFDPDPGVELPLNGIHWKGALDWGAIPVDDAEMSDVKVAEWVGGWLRSGSREPFFLGCGIRRPHDPFFVPQRYYDLFPLDDIQLPTVFEGDLDDVPARGPEDGRREPAPHDPAARQVEGGRPGLPRLDRVRRRAGGPRGARPRRERAPRRHHRRAVDGPRVPSR